MLFFFFFYYGDNEQKGGKESSYALKIAILWECANANVKVVLDDRKKSGMGDICK